ncbi:14414_t:CDS:2 [Entrophospora sp. SA101]|nr:2191_t:CDS:2 [Entrophospora sp. SA101]CAJ0840388.1 14414_t:CDS:2 [Entrophospora sp. SA101]
MIRIGVHFEFWQSTDSRNRNCTSLMDEDKLKVLKNYNLESVLPENRALIIHQLWYDFDDLYTALQDLTTNPIVFKRLYTNNDGTPYIYVLIHHMYDIYGDLP